MFNLYKIQFSKIKKIIFPMKNKTKKKKNYLQLENIIKRTK